MPLVLLTSTKTIWDHKKKAAWPAVKETLAQLPAIDVAVVVVSNKPEPTWFKPEFGELMFQQYQKRQGGGLVRELLEANKERQPNLGLSNFAVLSGCQDDMLMAANNRVLNLRAGWSLATGETWESYGVVVNEPSHLSEMAPLLTGNDPWYFRGEASGYKLWALTNAGTYGQTDEHTKLADSLKSYLKRETDVLSGFQLHLLSSVYREPALLNGKKTIWGYYPSSAVIPDLDHLMSKIVHWVREPLTNKLARRGGVEGSWDTLSASAGKSMVLPAWNDPDDNGPHGWPIREYLLQVGAEGQSEDTPGNSEIPNSPDSLPRLSSTDCYLVPASKGTWEVT